MKTWDDRSDFEINCGVAIALGCDVVIEFAHSSTSVYCGYEGLESTQDERDYCNKPADMWPIMLKNGIGIVAENGKLIGATTSSQQYYEPYGDIIYSYDHVNPLRAAAIVFLMMNGVNPE